MWRMIYSSLNQKKTRLSSTLSKARVIESSRHRNFASSRKSDEIFAKWWKNFEIITAYFVINKALQTAHLKHFESSAFWVLNISHISYSFSLFFSFSSVCRLSITRHLLDLFIELIVTLYLLQLFRWIVLCSWYKVMID